MKDDDVVVGASVGFSAGLGLIVALGVMEIVIAIVLRSDPCEVDAGMPLSMYRIVMTAGGSIVCYALAAAAFVWATTGRWTGTTTTSGTTCIMAMAGAVTICLWLVEVSLHITMLSVKADRVCSSDWQQFGKAFGIAYLSMQFGIFVLAFLFGAVAGCCRTTSVEQPLLKATV